MPPPTVRRLTLFKIPETEKQEQLLEMYRKMPNGALKVCFTRSISRSRPLTGLQDGKPYIVSVNAGKAYDDQRAQGYTVAVVSVFENVDDFIYYDTNCEAHSKLKAFAATVHKGNMMVYYEDYF
jgi:hypothetical protein